MSDEHSDGWESYWTYPDRWWVPHLEPLNVCIRYLRRADGNGASSASSSKPEMTTKLDYIQLAGNTFFLFRSSHGASSYIHVYKYVYICIYFHTVRLWPPLGTMRWMIPLLPRCFLVAFVHRYRLGYVPLSYYIYINIFNLRINFVDFFSYI